MPAEDRAELCLFSLSLPLQVRGSVADPDKEDLPGLQAARDPFPGGLGFRWRRGR